MNEHLHEQAIRNDLSWILNAPSLLADHPTLWSPEQLKDLDIQSVKFPLEKLVQIRKGKLGHYFEACVGLLFEAHPRFEILAANHVIHSSERTLGELDLVLNDIRTGQVIHLELALKFYLWVPGVSPTELAWVGSGLHDFFHQKLARLYNHQLKLPALARAQGVWPTHLPYPDEHLLWIPGRLYWPKQNRPPSPTDTCLRDTPWALNPYAHQSIWIENDDLKTPRTAALLKADWLNGQRTEEKPDHLPAQFVMEHHPDPMYVLPSQWQTNAQIALNDYLSRL